MQDEEKEFENQRRDINYVLWLGETLLPVAIAAFAIGVMCYFMWKVGT